MSRMRTHLTKIRTEFSENLKEVKDKIKYKFGRVTEDIGVCEWISLEFDLPI